MSPWLVVHTDLQKCGFNIIQFEEFVCVFWGFVGAMRAGRNTCFILIGYLFIYRSALRAFKRRVAYANVDCDRILLLS